MAATPSTTRTPGQIFAGVFGPIYVLIGIVGFFVTGFDDFAEMTGEELIVFEINPLHNLVHIAIGLAFLAGASSGAAARSMNTLIGVAYIAVAILGIPGWLDFLAIADGLSPDFWLHIVTGVLAVYFGTVGAGGRMARPG
jgi:Domain of unknown function (DUF4383)